MEVRQKIKVVSVTPDFAMEVPVIVSDTQEETTSVKAMFFPELIEIYLTKKEVINAMEGNLENIVPRVGVNIAKDKIMKVIDEIASKKKVKLNNQDKDKLANVAIVLLKKISDRI